MKKVLSLAVLVLSANAQSAAVWTNAKIDMVLAGYADRSVVFKPVGGAKNPALCSDSTAYAITADQDAKGALSIILAAKMADKTVYFSVRDDLCHTIQQTDAKGLTIPVVQRIGVQ
ncbi:hypothetical protein PVB89_004587 [Vibrio parahaemolyticus]|nr:hypothetical protein [Vibrio parahaemolyticus]